MGNHDEFERKGHRLIPASKLMRPEDFSFPDEPDAPYIDAFIDKTGEARIWCEHCGGWHRHGAYNGHRRAHCGRPHYDSDTGAWVESPYYQTGYNLRIRGPLTRDIKLRYEQRRGAISLKLRFAILKRDGYRCQICGRNAQDGVTLEVDHKVPWAKGGTDDPDNLWVLCFDCNHGKRTSDL
jgi:hypothetical protein